MLLSSPTFQINTKLSIVSASFDVAYHVNVWCRCHTHSIDQRRISSCHVWISCVHLSMVEAGTNVTRRISNATMRLSMLIMDHPSACSSTIASRSALQMPLLSTLALHSGMLLASSDHCTSLQMRCFNWSFEVASICTGVGMTSRWAAAVRCRQLMACLGLGVDRLACFHSSSSMGSPKMWLATASA